MKIGLINGRHEMPVDSYLLAHDVTDQYGYGQELIDHVNQSIDSLMVGGQLIDLYLTGLTVVAVAAVVRLSTYGINHFYSYNPEIRDYERLEIA